jgi:hypothetical protein
MPQKVVHEINSYHKYKTGYISKVNERKKTPNVIILMN